MSKRTPFLLAFLVLAISIPLIAQTGDPATQQPVATEGVQPADSGEASPDATVDESRELPRTASPLPLIALIGGASGGAALALRRRR